MGWNERLRQLGGGVADLFSAPVGLIWDSARAIADPNFNPGVFGPLGQGVEKLVGGISKISEATGLSTLGANIAEVTPVDDILSKLLYEGELLYNTEFQQTFNQAPIGLRQLNPIIQKATDGERSPFDPGDISGQRIGATALGAASTVLPGGTPIQDVGGVWRRSLESTPGRALVDNLWFADFYSKTPQEQEHLRSQVWYNMATGTIDAATRWFTQPEVLAGKGIKSARSRMNPTPEKLLERANQVYKKHGISFEVIEGAEGAVNLQIRGAEGQEMLHVVRSSQLDSMKAEGILRVPDGAIEDFELDQFLDNIRTVVRERTGIDLEEGRVVGDEEFDQVIQGDVASRFLTEGDVEDAAETVSEILSDLYLTMEDAGASGFSPLDMDLTDPRVMADFFMDRGRFESYLRTVEGIEGPELEMLRDAMLRHQLFGDAGDIPTGRTVDEIEELLLKAEEEFGRHLDLEGGEQYSPGEMNWALDMMELGGANPAILSVVGEAWYASARQNRFSAISEKAAGRGLRATSPEIPGSVPHPSYRGLFLLGEGDYDEAMRYATALYKADPNDLPVIVHIKADGLPVIFEDYMNPMVTDRRSELPSDASLFTLADQIAPDKITRIEPLGPEVLDQAMFQGLDIPGYFAPGGRVHPRLYDPDGGPINPEDILDVEEFGNTFLTLSRLYSESPLMAQKFIRNMAASKAVSKLPEGVNPLERMMGHKSIQDILNWVDGKGADEIRRIVFPDHVYGGILANHLSEVKTYAERRVILAAAMGYRTPDFGILPELLQTRLKVLTEEFDRMQKGQPPNQRALYMLQEEDLLAVAPDQAHALFEETISEVQGALDRAKFIDSISKAGGVIREMPKVPKNRMLSNYLRKQEWYTDTPLGKGVRSVIEYRPHQFVNVKDVQSDIQLVRQLDEAKAVGVSDTLVRQFHQRYLAARTSKEKVKILLDAENQIIVSAARHARMSVEEITDLLENARRGRAGVSEYLTSRRYGPDGTDRIEFPDTETGEAVIMTMPLLSTQVESWVPLADVREIIRVSSKIRRLKARGSKVPSEILNQFNQIWKPTVLLRGGWPLRVVTDEQLRILAKTGSLMKHLAAIELGENIQFTSVTKKGLTVGQRVAAGYVTVTGTQPLVALAVKSARAVTKAGKKLGLVDPEHYALMKQAGLEELVSSRASFGGPNEEILHGLQALFGRDEATILDHLISKGTGQWRSVASDSREFGPAWVRVLNDQIGRDPLANHLIQTIVDGLDGGLDMDAISEIFLAKGKAFLRTKEGIEIADSMPWRSTNPDKWMEQLYQMIGSYTGDFDIPIMRKIVSGKKITTKDLELVDEALRPATVHGEIIDQMLGNSAVTQYIRDFVAGTYDLMGRLPTDTLSRQPFFKQLYADEMQRLRRITEKQGGVLDEATIKLMDTNARTYAINEAKSLLYDLAETSRFGHMMRFVMPFYPAWQEVLSVWSGLVIADPSIIGRAVLLWNAPNRAGIVQQDDDGTEFMQIRLSEKMADNLELTGWKRYLATGGVRFAKDSFNLVLNSPLPGVGPLIQMPINDVVKNSPELEESLRWALPFGVKNDIKEIIFSPLVRQLSSEMKGPEKDKAYQRDFINAVTWMDIEYRSGRSTTPPTVEEAHNIARKIFSLRFLARLSAPAQPIFDSPMQPYADLYRDLIEQYGPEQADEIFLNHYGQEFFAVTLSRTVSTTGLPPTVEAEVARQQYEGLIERFPEYGRLIVGDESLGEFSSAAFAAQMSRDTDKNPTTPGTEREYRSVEIDPRTGGIIEVDRRLGWQEYIRLMDLVDLERKKRGLPNLRVAEAQDLAQIRRALIQDLSQKYPSWFEDFSTRDDLKWQKRIEAFKDMASNPLLDDRPDMDGVQQYMEYRSLILQELNRRDQMGGAKTLAAASNADLAEIWETLVAQILTDNLAFGPVYYRYLEGDPVR